MHVQAGPNAPNVGRAPAGPRRSTVGTLAVAIFGALMVLVVTGLIFFLTMRPAENGAPARPYVGPNVRLDTSPKLRKVEAPDATKVDIADLVSQARAVALATDSHVDKLSSVVAFQVAGGVLDATQSNAASISFSFRYTDPTKRPGEKDVVEGAVIVRVHDGGLEPRKQDGLTDVKGLSDPKCSSKEVWSVAVKSGVPENAVATFHVYDNSAFSPKSPTVWSIRVEGHDEYRREIDAATCALVKNWANKK